MTKRKMTIATLAAVLLLAGTAIAQPGGMSGRSMGNRGMGEQRSGGAGGDFFQRMLPMMRMLDLTDDQRDAIADIMEEAGDSIESVRGTEEAGSHREAFLELFSSSNITASQIETLLNERLQTMEEVNGIIARALADIHGVLTSEQLAALAEFDPGSMEMRMGANEGGRGNHHPGMNMGVHPGR